MIRHIIAVSLLGLGLAGCVVYQPAPYYYAPAASNPGATNSSDQTCREYQTTTTIDGKPQPTRGTACLQPDGTWRTTP
jgi:surface antigen